MEDTLLKHFESEAERIFRNHSDKYGRYAKELPLPLKMKQSDDFFIATMNKIRRLSLFYLENTTGNQKEVADSLSSIVMSYNNKCLEMKRSITAA
ncbi:hypothetical protein ACFQ1M_07430 [Sungkyunkwania multivorans]|uniref:Uncharacterized protein n=1 Tax=Sungkyunkwania multivorans TaxID=1173618 RepID=A0ABW3CW89_9FLAO